MKRSKLPLQAAPVERTIAGTPMSNQSGVDPSFNWGGLLKDVASAALPAVLGAI